MATHSRILAWRILQTEELSTPQSIRSQRVRHDLATKSPFNLCMNEAQSLISCVADMIRHLPPNFRQASASQATQLKSSISWHNDLFVFPYPVIHEGCVLHVISQTLNFPLQQHCLNKVLQTLVLLGYKFCQNWTRGGDSGLNKITQIFLTTRLLQTYMLPCIVTHMLCETTRQFWGI